MLKSRSSSDHLNGTLKERRGNQLTAKHLKITDIRNYVRQKMEKAQKYFDHIIWGQAFVHIDKRA